MNRVPKLRFPEFSGEWEEKKLGELLEFKNGINASKEQYGQGIKFINVLDILNNDFITYKKIIGRVDIDEETLKKYPVTYGDILFQRSSETRDEVGTANVYLDKKNMATFGGFVIRGKKIGEYNPIFMNKVLKTPLARNEITSKSGGSTRYNVGQETLSQVRIFLATLPEQQEIASFLSSVDSKIEKLERKKELWEQYKKGMMQKIFSQELRFKDENGEDYPEWEEKRLEEVAEIYQPKTISQSELTDSGYPVYGANGIIGSFHSYNHENPQVAVTCRGNTCGTVNYTKEMSWITGNAMVINTDDYDVSKKFIYYALTCDDLRYLITGSGQPQITGNIKTHKVKAPSLPEQTQIADFLSSIDSKTEIIQKEISGMKEFKKGLLQQMFV